MVKIDRLNWSIEGRAVPMRRATSGRRRREHTHAHTLDMHGSPPCATSGCPGRQCSELPGTTLGRRRALRGWQQARASMRAPWPVAHEAGGELRVAVPRIYFPSPRPMEELRVASMAGNIQVSVHCCKRTIHMLKMFRKNVASISCICCKSRSRYCNITYVASV